jgi:hypothetical protein
MHRILVQHCDFTSLVARENYLAVFEEHGRAIICSWRYLSASPQQHTLNRSTTEKGGHC